jgi:succinate-semialdehyde dehydrogenase
MVKAAYSSGTPAFGVGQGNVPALISAGLTEAELDSAITQIVNNRAADNGMPCTCPQIAYIPRSKGEKILKMLVDKGGYLVDRPEDIDRIRALVFNNGPTGRMDVNLVGIPAAKLARAYGLADVPADKKVILLKLKDGVRAKEDCLNREIMNPTLRFQFYDEFRDAVEIARANLLNEGAGHSAQVWSSDKKEIDLAARRLPVVRILVQQPGSGVTNLFWQNGMAPSTTIGCGTWGGNGFSDNLDYTTLQNKTMIIRRISEAPRLPTFEQLFGHLQ